MLYRLPLGETERGGREGDGARPLFSSSHMEEPILATGGPCRGNAVETRPGLEEGLTRGANNTIIIVNIAIWQLKINQSICQSVNTDRVFMTHSLMT